MIFTALAELEHPQIAESEQATGMPKNKAAAREGVAVSRRRRGWNWSRGRASRWCRGNFLPPKKKDITKGKKK